MFLRSIVWLLLLFGLLCGQIVLPDDEEVAVQAGDYLNRFQELKENPLDINKASARRLREIPFLNRELIAAIVNYRRENAPFRTLDELRLVSGISGELLEAMRAYLYVERKPRAINMLYEQRLATTAHKTRAYLRKIYGNRLAVRQRFLLQLKDRFKLILQTEKDAGEPRWVDHASASAAIEVKRLRSSIVLGDYHLWFAQGLVSGGAYGKRLTAGGGHSPLKPTTIRVRQKTGTDEFAFLRGVSWQLHPIDSLQLNLLLSTRQLDGVLAEDSLTVQRLINTGYHRSEAEIVRQNIQREMRFAIGGKWKLRRLRVGTFYQKNRYSRPQQFGEFVFRDGASSAISFAYHGESWHQSMEYAQGLRGKAFMMSIVTQANGLRFGAGMFYYSPDFISPHGRRFGAFGQLPNNRRGVQFLQNLTLPASIRISAHLETSRPVLSHTAFPITSWATSVSLAQRFARLLWKLRFSQRISGSEELRRKALQVRRRMRLELEHQPTKRLRLIQRVEYSRSSGKRYGITFLNDLRFSVPRIGSVQLRYTHFDVPSFDLRLYELETGLPGELETRLLNGRGYKWFALATVSPTAYLKIGLKYRVEYFPDEETLGTGNDLIAGNARRYLRGYLRLRW